MMIPLLIPIYTHPLHHFYYNNTLAITNENSLDDIK